MDIFDSAEKKGEFAKLKVLGDAVQGTWIDVIFGKDQFKNDQIIYVLKDKTGKVWNVGFKIEPGFIQKEMEGVRFGQNVGFRVDDVKPSKNKAGIMVKYVHAYHKITDVNAEWIAEQVKALASLGKTLDEYQAERMKQSVQSSSSENTGNYDDVPPFPNEEKRNGPLGDVIPEKSAPVATQPQAPVAAVNETLQAIYTLATNKGLVPAGSSPEVANALIVAFTGVPLTEENYTTAIVKVSSFTK